MVLVLILLGVIVPLLAVTRVVTGAAAQTRAYYAFLRYWGAHWPFNRGRGLPRRLRPVLKPFVPVWVQVEPAVRMLLVANDLVSRIILETGVWEEASWLAIQQHFNRGATFVDANPNFKSHRICDTSNSWFNYVSGPYNNPSPGSFHPTPDGQQSGYEASFEAAGL